MDDLSLRATTPTGGEMWVEVVTQPPQAEVVVESEPMVFAEPDRSLTGRALWTPTSEDSNSVGLEDSLHFQKSGSMQTITQLIGKDTRTSFEHVNQIIKHGAAAVKGSLRKAPASSVIVENKSPTTLSHRNPAQHVVKKVIVIQPWDDPEKATSEAISKITENLNREAAQRLAAGKAPDTETVIEITRINTPADGVISPVNALASEMEKAKLPEPASPEKQSSPEERRHRRRKSPHPKRYMYHTPSPPQPKSRSTSRSTHSLNAHCYFESKPRASRAHTTASSKLLGLSLQNSANQTCSSPAPSSSSSAAHQPTASAKLQAAINSAQNKPTILRTNRQSSVESTPSSASAKFHMMHHVRPTSLSLDRSLNGTPVVAMDVGENTENKDPESSKTTSGSSRLNESLTNIQWLGAMSGDSLDPVKASSSQPRDPRALASDRQIEKISKECGRKKRPPYSYMHLIQMAICSKEDKRMTLKEIYKWIEEKFPYYKFCTNQGWKNSIRHNLSLYDIFIREKETNIHGKPGMSYWTLRADVPLKTNKALQSLISDGVQNSSQESSDSGYTSQNGYYYQDEHSSIEQAGSTVSSKSKKGPVPLLPKPPPMQTYALIPIQHGMPVIPQQPIVVSSLSPNPAQVLNRASQHRAKPQPVDSSKGIRIRPASATEFLKRSHPTADLQAEFKKLKRPGSAFELLRSASHSAAGRATASTSSAQRPSSACDLLAREAPRPQGMVTPPPMHNEDLIKPVLKRAHSPSTATGCSDRKHVKIAPTVGVYDDKTQTVQHYLRKNRSATSTVTNASSTMSESPLRCEHMDTSELQHQLLHMKFADSGFISDSSSLDQTTSGTDACVSGLPKPKMYLAESSVEGGGYILTSTPSDCGSDINGGAMLSIDCDTEAGLHDILSSIEKSLSSPMRNLLRTPPKSAEKNLFTSTPFKITFGSPSWLSPIKGLTPDSGVPNLEDNLFTPLKEGKTTATSTPTIKSETGMNPKASGSVTPPDLCKRLVTTHGLTPLRTPFKSPLSKDIRTERSPGDFFSNQSFSKLMGEFHFESMIDEGINMDVSNMSFSALQ